MDRIVKHLVEDFLQTHEFQSEDLARDFEKFANYSIISREFNKTFEVESVTVGDGDDTGIDGLAIIVNGQLVENIEDIDFLLENNNFLEATYIFIQSKTSPSFNASEMNNFSFGVKDFFAEEPKLRRNTDIEDFAEISDYLLTKASYFRANPTCKLFFVTTGVWNEEDQNHQAIIETATSELMATNLFRKVLFAPTVQGKSQGYFGNQKVQFMRIFYLLIRLSYPTCPV